MQQDFIYYEDSWNEPQSTYREKDKEKTLTGPWRENQIMPKEKVK